MQNACARHTATMASFMLLVACGGDDDSNMTDGGSRGPDAMYSPSNPAGLGPAPVDLGTATDLAAAGSYVVLAKTGITNVTGSSITGGHLGLSPAAASFITGFAMTADASNVYSTSAAARAHGKIYPANYAMPTPRNYTPSVSSMQAAQRDAETGIEAERQA